MRIEPDEFLALDLEAHDLLRGFPLHDVSRVDLSGGGPGRTILDVRPLLSMERAASSSPALRALFSLRFAMGRVFGWDEEAGASRASERLVDRLRDDQRARSLVPPETKEGPFEVVYVFPNEAVAEIRNATVRAVSCMALVPHGEGYRFYWGIYVAPVSWITPYYMALIEPFRRFVVYPTILRRLRREWDSLTDSRSR